MKQVNLISLIESKDTVEFQKYLEYLEIKTKKTELDDIEKLCDSLKKISGNIKIFENFYVGYTIPQIGKEFDLLRFGDEKIVNIEIKSESTEEKILKQLKRNKYYLSLFKKELYLCTYVSSTDKLYFLDDDDNLLESKFDILVEKLEHQKCSYDLKINQLFKPSAYLVSPFNSTDSFINGNYFLTLNQEEFEIKIINIVNQEGAKFIAVKGRAGCGKTLLTYHIGKKLRITNNVIFIHCGTLNDGHIKLKDLGWNIISIRDIGSINYDDNPVIIVDEAQRINLPYQLEGIINSVNERGLKCIFSYDEEQILKSNEAMSSITIENSLTQPAFKLTNKIRTNKNLANFIKCLFHRTHKVECQKSEDIQIKYFNNKISAMKFVDISRDDDWKYINYTPSRSVENYDITRCVEEDINSHKVMGQEFEKVMVMIHSSFYYKSNKLSIRGNPFYDTTKMLFQNVTRTKNKLTIVIVNNEAVLDRCLEILTNN